MAQKADKNMKKKAHKQDEVMWGSVWLFCAGCAAELYLMVLRKFYIDGNLHQVVAWSDYLKVLPWLGVAVLVLGAALAVVKKADAKLCKIGMAVAGAGAFFAAASFLIRTFMMTAYTPLSVIVPVVTLLGILWSLYDRECSYALSLLGVTLLVLWLCRKGIGNAVWNTRVMACAAIYAVLMVVLAVVFRKAEKTKGVVGKFRLLPEKSEAALVYGSCAVSAVVVLLAMFGATIAYYAMWAVCLGMFVLAVYYTVRQL